MSALFHRNIFNQGLLFIKKHFGSLPKEELVTVLEFIACIMDTEYFKTKRSELLTTDATQVLLTLEPQVKQLSQNLDFKKRIRGLTDTIVSLRL